MTGTRPDVSSRVCSNLQQLSLPRGQRGTGRNTRSGTALYSATVYRGGQRGWEVTRPGNSQEFRAGCVLSGATRTLPHCCTHASVRTRHRNQALFSLHEQASLCRLSPTLTQAASGVGSYHSPRGLGSAHSWLRFDPRHLWTPAAATLCTEPGTRVECGVQPALLPRVRHGDRVTATVSLWPPMTKLVTT